MTLSFSGSFRSCSDEDERLKQTEKMLAAGPVYSDVMERVQGQKSVTINVTVSCL